jgi:ubiquinone biosynthesis protein
MHERVGFQGLRRSLDKEAAQWAQLMPQLPRLVHAHLSRPGLAPELNLQLERMRRTQEHTNRVLMALCAILAVAVGVAIWALTRT